MELITPQESVNSTLLQFIIIMMMITIIIIQRCKGGRVQTLKRWKPETGRYWTSVKHSVVFKVFIQPWLMFLWVNKMIHELLLVLPIPGRNSGQRIWVTFLRSHHPTLSSLLRLPPKTDSNGLCFPSTGSSLNGYPERSSVKKKFF